MAQFHPRCGHSRSRVTRSVAAALSLGTRTSMAAFLTVLHVGLLFTLGHAGDLDVGFKVIVNFANPTASMSRSELSELFLKKTTRWKHGQRAAPVDLADGHPARNEFSKAILGKPTSSVASYWQQQIFSGKEVPPPALGSDAEVVAYVKSNPGAVGYVSPSSVTWEVKVLEITN